MRKPIVYGSVCSGIEAATVAWHPLGWKPSFFSEIEAFPRAVLKHHYPHVPLHGDFTTIQAGDYEPIDLLVGGTPCQSFSVAGLRGGLGDDRGNLALEYLRLADRLRPRWLVWENVPGVLSSNGGLDFGSILGGMVKLGYGVSYRVLDAQHFGVPQRRRRVFVVGYLGDWRCAAAVLFERHSLSGNPPPRRQARERVARQVTPGSPGGSGYRNDADTADNLIAGTLQHGTKSSGSATTQDAESGLLIAHTLSAARGSACAHAADLETYIPTAFGGSANCAETTVSTAVSAHPGGYRLDFETETFMTHSLRADGFDASEDGTGRGTPLGPVACTPIPFDTTQITSPANVSNPQAGDTGHPLAAGAHAPAVVFDCKASGRNGFGVGDQAPTLRAMGHKDGQQNGGGQVAVAFDYQQGGAPSNSMREWDQAGTLETKRIQALRLQSAVRRLTPRECERLQGAPDNYTLIPYGRPSKQKLDEDFLKYQLRGNPKHLAREDVDRLAKDGPRYKSLGNSMAIPCMRWIGERIKLVEDLDV